MLFDLFEAIGNANVYNIISIFISGALLLLVCLPIHEYAHALAATKLGDNTAKYQGRLSLNPFRHLDLLGSALILLFGFGYAKPVPVNMFNLRNKKNDMAIIAAAGPISNFLMAIAFILLHNIFSLIFNLLTFTNVNALNVAYVIFGIIYQICFYGAFINISLGIFNLIPIPPFDGSRILGKFLPDSAYYKLMQYERFIFIGVLLLLSSGFSSNLLSNAIFNVYSFFDYIISLPFSLIGG